MNWRMSHSNGNNKQSFWRRRNSFSAYYSVGFATLFSSGYLEEFFLTLFIYKRHTHVTCMISFGIEENANHTNTPWLDNNHLDNITVHCLLCYTVRLSCYSNIVSGIFPHILRELLSYINSYSNFLRRKRSINTLSKNSPIVLFTISVNSSVFPSFEPFKFFYRFLLVVTFSKNSISDRRTYPNNSCKVIPHLNVFEKRVSENLFHWKSERKLIRAFSRSLCSS